MPTTPPGSATGSGSPTDPQVREAPAGAGRRARRRLPRAARAALLVLVTVLLCGLVDLGSALMAPSQDGLAAKAAEWARSRGLGGLVSGAEWAAYQLNPPPTGGVPSGGIPIDAKPVTGKTGAGACGNAPMPTLAGTPLPDEGAWQPIERVGAKDAIVATFVRPDSSHTQFLTGITCIDQSLASFVLHPGTQLPGGTGWSQKPTVAGSLGTLLATFNSGFRMDDSQGGFWMDGKSSGTLEAGQASMVFYSNGHLDVRSWEGGAPAAGIAAVRQNLVLLVDDGQITDAVRHADNGAFGKTVGDTTYVWRSGVGIRPDGSIVTAHGNALSVETLALILKEAGAVRAMELDINPDWTSYIYYDRASGTVVPHKLTSDQVRPANRYLQTSTRDFVAVVRR